MNRWIEAARPRTLPLAIASILLGNFLAYAAGKFSFLTAALAILTTLLLQILSNFANDFGDSKNGVDNKNRKVALRAVQTGKISPSEMKNAVIIAASLSFISGISLLYFALQYANPQTITAFVGLGLLAILAAIAYTVGKKPYGYMGLGDLSVFLFFGWVGTFGTFYLQTEILNYYILIPASGCGFLSVAVLNLNNLRDVENDRKTGKNSIPVRIGKVYGFYYQKTIMLLGVCTFIIYLMYQGKPIQLSQNIIIMAGWYPLVQIIKQLNSKMTPAQIDPYLKKTALSTLFLIVIFGVSQIFLS
ncbi:MAG: 1,4-dihydroxy-2-naphthoate polyprenyltransferase [Cytophagales bacterium]|nr:1,4-dihydroxy-2-naphthoate polyprenyltransferase [Cytophagales bacterium]